MRCGAVQCGAPSVQGTRAVPVKTGNLGLPKRGAGDLRTRGGETLGVLPVSLVDSKAGPSSKWPWAYAPIMLRCFLGFGHRLVESSMKMQISGRSSDLDIDILLRDPSVKKQTQASQVPDEKGKIVVSGKELGPGANYNNDKAIVPSLVFTILLLDHPETWTPSTQVHGR